MVLQKGIYQFDVKIENFFSYWIHVSFDNVWSEPVRNPSGNTIIFPLTLEKSAYIERHTVELSYKINYTSIWIQKVGGAAQKDLMLLTWHFTKGRSICFIEQAYRYMLLNDQQLSLQSNLTY